MLLRARAKQALFLELAPKSSIGFHSAKTEVDWWIFKSLTFIMQPSLWLLNLFGAFVCDRILGTQLLCPTDEGFQWYTTPAHVSVPSSGGQSNEKTNEWVIWGLWMCVYMKSLVFYKAYFSCHCVCVCVAGCVCRVGGQFCVGPLWRWPTLMPCPVVTMVTSCPGWSRPRGW